MPSKSGRNILECYIRNVKPPSCAKLVLLCKFARTPLTISIAKRKRSLWPSSPPPLLCATSSGTQSRRASTYLQGNSRVDKQFSIEDKTRAIISCAGERGNKRDTSPPPWRRRFCSFGFPDSRSAPHYASSEQHGGQPGTERPRTSLKGLDSLKSRSSFSESAALGSLLSSSTTSTRKDAS